MTVVRVELTLDRRRLRCKTPQGLMPGSSHFVDHGGDVSSALLSSAYSSFVQFCRKRNAISTADRLNRMVSYSPRSVPRPTRSSPNVHVCDIHMWRLRYWYSL